MWKKFKEFSRKYISFIKSNSEIIGLRFIQISIALDLAVAIWAIFYFMIIFNSPLPMKEVLIIGQDSEILWETQGRYNFRVNANFISWVDEEGNRYQIAIDHYDYTSIIVRDVSDEFLPSP